MKKIVHISLLTSCIIALGIGVTACGRSSSNSLFHHKGVLTPSAQAAFQTLGVTITSLSEANEFAQKHLLRVGERWDTQEDNSIHARMHEHQAVLINDVRALGMVDAVDPAQQHYTYALLMGATTGRFKQRLSHLADLMMRGYTFDYIVLLGGERPLRDVERQGLPETITTEAQMMEYICAQNDQCMGEQIILVNAPMIKKPDGTLIRPTTDDTLRYFSEIAPQDGSCLVISNNPYLVRQLKVAQRILDQSRFLTHGAGSALEIDRVGIIMVMDEFARTVYEDNLSFLAGK